ncbi:MAG: FG-GAP-like repeat-containing protein [Tenuifilaceae bacterium]|nr:FG-GAP-like repeat-containing protein [Tenuifilaceae bacterium]
MKNFTSIKILLAFLSFCFLCNPIQSQINTSLPVGTTNGQGSVAPTGAFTYQVPLFIPEGTGGLVPQLFLTYSSQSGDGVMGVGWGVSGLSSIGRTSKTIYHDGITEGVNFSDADALSLDGSRLICVSGTHGTSGARYRTEMETFIEIIQNGSGVSSSFLVRTKEGNELHYGISGNSRLKAGGSSITATWLLEKIVDPMGNQVQFFYIIGTGEARVDRIEYSGNAIKFSYEDRPDPNKRYVDGYAFKQTKRLTSIKMESDGSAIREYKLAYETGSPTLLSSITEHGRSGQKLNPLVFSWGGVTDLLIDEYEPYIGDQEKASMSYYGDFNGDGRTDFVRVIRTNEVGAAWERWDLYLANSSGTSFTKKSGGSLGDWFKGFYVADVNNDGRMDLLLRRKTTYKYCIQYCNDEPGDEDPIGPIDPIPVPIDDYEPECCAWTNRSRESFLFYTFNGSTMVRGEENYDLHFENTPDDVIMNAGLDFNGDGQTDYLLLDKNQNMFRVKFSNGYSAGSYYLPSFNNPDKVEFLDFNGDGRTDIMVIKDSNTKIYTFNPASHQWDTLYSGGFPTKWHEVFLGDFNGDGNTDILAWTEAEQWYLHFSTGKGYTWPAIESLPFHNTEPNGSADNMVFVKDFNGDGKDDILQITTKWITPGEPITTYHVFQSNGDGTFLHELKICSSSGYFSHYHFGDCNGDGINDIIKIMPFSGKVRTMLVRKDQDRTLLQSVTDGLGRTLSVEYKSLPKTGQYTPGAGSTFPLIDYNGTFFVVSKTQFSYPDLPTTINVFSYTGAAIHRQGKGFLGFKKFKKTNQTTGDWAEMEFEIMPTFYYPMLKKTISGIGAQQTATETNTNAISDLGNKRFFAYVQKVISRNLLKGVTVITDFEFDGFGNLTRRRTNFGGQATEEVINNYALIGAWCPSRLMNSTITKKRISPADTKTQSFSYAYYPQGLLKSESGMGINKNYTYDSYGNMASVILTGSGANGSRTTSYQYDSKGRVTKVTEPGNFVTEYTRTPYTGWVQKKELPNGNYISYTYDGFGRVTYTTTAVAGPTAFTHSWANGEYGARTKITTKPTGLPPTTVWYDAYDREIRREEPGLSSTMVTSNSFNSKGQLSQVTNPDNTKVSYTYDSFGRLKSETHIDLSKTYTYSGNTVTVTSPRDVSVTEYDALGNVLESSVNGQKVTYTYNALSQPLSTTPQWGAPVTMEYDVNGFQSKIIDPAAGTIEYTHNAFGELLSQKNNRGQTCITSYDYIGRVIGKLWPGYSATFEYYDDGGGKGMIKKATFGDISEEYFYDTYGRMNKVQLEGASVNPLSFQYTFNSFGGITSIIYPNGLIINRDFQNGYLNEIKSHNGTTIWRVENVNQSGQITQSYIGNNMNRYNSYDIYGFPTSIKTTQGSSIKQHFTYSFDTNKGNMTQRKDEKYNLVENFGYDEFHRLTTTAQPHWGTTLVNRYGANGNITQKTDVGSLKYNLTPNVYAVTALNGDSSYEPQNQRVGYTPFERPSEVANGAWVGEFTYGPNLQRRLMKLYEKGVLNETWLYFGSYEEKQLPNGEVYKYCYVNSPEGPIALYQSVNSSESTKYNILKDHLGSVTALVDEGGNIVAEYSYDPWGRRRNPLDYGDYDIDQSQLMVNRGYTFHEHLGRLDVVNMNARLYDPALGRFLSPDPHVQAPAHAQNFNRYSYALNNPLVYTDPSGEFIFTALALIIPGGQAFLPWAIGADIGMWGGGTAANGTMNPFKWDYNDGKTWAGMGIGLVAGGLGGGIGTGSIGGLAGLEAVMAGGVVAGGINGAGMTALAGGDFGDIMGGMIQNAVIGGFTAAAGYGAFQGMEGLIGNIPGHNTVSYFTAASASKVTGNLLTGQKPFNNYSDIYKNPAWLLPATMDFVSISGSLLMNSKFGPKIANNLAKKYMPEGWFEEGIVDDISGAKLNFGINDKGDFGLQLDYWVRFPHHDTYTSTNSIAWLNQYVTINPLNSIYPLSLSLTSRNNYYMYAGMYVNLFNNR